MGKCSVNDDFIRLQAVSDSTVSGAFHPFLKTRILFFLGTLFLQTEEFHCVFLTVPVWWHSDFPSGVHAFVLSCSVVSNSLRPHGL